MLLVIGVNIAKFQIRHALFADSKLLKKAEKIVVVFQKSKKLGRDTQPLGGLSHARAGSLHQHQRVRLVSLKAPRHQHGFLLKLRYRHSLWHEFVLKFRVKFADLSGVGKDIKFV